MIRRIFQEEEVFNIELKAHGAGSELGRSAERRRIIDLMEHQEVWNSLDNKWVHPTYCLTCRNIERITEGQDSLSPTWSEEVTEMKQEWDE
jgi:hypothetical protein